MKRRSPYIVVILILFAILAVALLQLQRRARVSDIISDEARWDVLDSLSAATQMKVVILQDGTVARYVSEDEDTYTCDIQDAFPVSKTEARVELRSASDGEGIVYLKEPGSFPTYSGPDTASPRALDLVYEDGCVPDTYPCLGLEDGWYKIVVGGGQAYIEAEYVNWDAIDSF